MLGYLYSSEVLANEAVNLLNLYYGIPVCDESVTQSYTMPVEWGEQWAIMYDDTLPVVLGAPVVLPPIPND
jgi:hypothetical protein